MWIAQQRDGHIYVGGIPGEIVPLLVAHLRKAGVPAPSKVTPETRGISGVDTDVIGPQGLRFEGVKAEDIQQYLDSFRD